MNITILNATETGNYTYKFILKVSGKGVPKTLSNREIVLNIVKQGTYASSVLRVLPTKEEEARCYYQENKQIHVDYAYERKLGNRLTKLDDQLAEHKEAIIHYFFNESPHRIKLLLM